MSKHNGVSVVQSSENPKVGVATVTYASQATCPQDCPLLGAGCYAEAGRVSFATRRVNASGTGMSPDELAQEESEAIDAIADPEGEDLRLHIVGDCTTNVGAKLLAGAARRWKRRGGGRVWKYTHGWRTVAKSSWKGVSILASCETLSQVRQARKRRYATALVVDSFRQKAAYEVEGVKLLPCPNQTIGVQCVRCGLCMDADRLYAAGLTIAFEAHGAKQNQIRRALPLVK